MAPKTGSKKLVETWRPERDLDCMSPGLRKKAQDAQYAVLRFLKFSVSIGLTRRLRFLKFWMFSVYYAIYKMNRGLRFLKFSVSIALTRRLRFFVQRGLGIL